MYGRLVEMGHDHDEDNNFDVRESLILPRGKALIS
jgi:hypothetical protein